MSRAVVSTNQFRSERGTVTTSAPVGGVLVALAGGGWGYDPTGVADAGLAAVAGGGFGADDSVTTGLPLFALGTSVFTF